MRRAALLLATLLPAAALAVPQTLTHQARVLDASGAPISGTRDVVVRLYDQGGVARFTEAFDDVDVADGYLTVVLGANGALTTEVLLIDPLFLGLQLGAEPELPTRQQLHATAYARHAGGVTLGAVSACTPAAEGTLRWQGGLSVCDGAAWVQVRLGRDGSLQSPGVSCKQILDDYPDSTSGPYHLRVGGETVQVYCEMSFAEGGWTRIATVDGTLALCNLAAATGTAAAVAAGTGNAWLAASVVDQIPWQREVLLYDSSTNWTRFTSNHADWKWSNVANGTVHTHTVDTYGVSAWSDGGTGYAALTDGTGCQPSASWPGYCMLGGNEAVGWTVILGIGRYARGAFTQDASCQALSDDWWGLYGGAGVGSWGQDGQVYIR